MLFKLKKIIFLFLLILIISISNIYAIENIIKDKNEIDNLKIDSISVLMDNDYPPYVFRDENNILKGYLVDEWMLWEKYTGIKVQIHAMDWDKALISMDSGDYDVIDTIFYSEERAKKYSFVRQYAEIEVPIFFNKSISGINSVQTLKGFNVAVKKSDNVIRILKDYGITNLIEYDSFHEMISDVKNNNVHIFVADKPSGIYYLYKMKLYDKFNITKPIYVGKMYKAVKKDDAKIAEIIDSGFLKIPKEEIDNIKNEWFGNPITSTNMTNIIRIISGVILLVVIIFFVLIVWNRTLQIKVEHKTSELILINKELKENEEKLFEISIKDSLTRLYNRYFFEKKVYELIKDGIKSAGFIILDVDGLKFINDTLGHFEGDKYLKNTAKLLLENFRKEDYISRYGGDEFTIFLPQIKMHELEYLCENFKNLVNEYNKKVEIPLSISFGYAYREADEIEFESMLKEADNFMYRKKLHIRQSVKSEIVGTMMKMLEARDFITEGHAERMQDLAISLAKSLNLKDSDIDDITLLAKFHDIGKVGIPDSILFKNGKLSNEEKKVMNTHTEIGYRIAQTSVELMSIGDGILKHHEWWNGKGYPIGLSGEDIPLKCRIISIVDSYDAMINDRPYRKAMSKSEAIEELKRCSGTQFDPHLVDQFIRLVM